MPHRRAWHWRTATTSAWRTATSSQRTWSSPRRTAQSSCSATSASAPAPRGACGERTAGLVCAVPCGECAPIISETRFPPHPRSGQQDHHWRQVVGTATFTAPEVWRGSYTTRCDVWSLGVTAFYLLTGYYPFGSATKQAGRAYAPALVTSRFPPGCPGWCFCLPLIRRSVRSSHAGERPCLSVSHVTCHREA